MPPGLPDLGEPWEMGRAVFGGKKAQRADGGVQRRMLA